ncbi:MAG TPA: class I tRNA ligase family protein, partial [Patescibacteria group bacterium]|nr:class I tRNA ligase family protein [Patescibacteria group bacterium]
KTNSHERRSAQTVCYLILDTLTRDMAPILSLLAEQISDHYQKNKTESIHLQFFTTDYLNNIPLHLFRAIQKHNHNQDQTRFFERYELFWAQLKKMRATILKAIEVLREQGTIKHSLEAKVVVILNQNNSFFTSFQEFIASNLELLELFVAEFTIVSQVHILLENKKDMTNDYHVQAVHAEGSKCPRCWQWQPTNHPDGLCKRCVEIVV